MRYVPSVTREHQLDVNEISTETMEALQTFKPLNDRQRAFVYNYLLTGSVPEASKRAGYTSKHGWSLINRPDINSFIRDNHRYWSNTEIASVEEVMMHLTDIVRGEATDVIINAKTGKRETIPAPTLARLKALEHLTKAYGLNNHNITIQGTITHDNSPKREVVVVEELKDVIELSEEDIEVLEGGEE